MVCKNCNNPLRTDYSYCPDCGAKVIRNRITVKNLWYDTVERFFNLDNTFLKTITHLFTKPEDVIMGYINGTRKKYLNPISYVTIALTLTSILVFFIKRAYPEGMDFDIFETGVYDVEGNKRMTNFLMNFFNIIFIIQIPLYAMASWITFNDIKKLFLSEHFVIFIYTQAQFSFVSLPISLVVVSFFPEYYMNLSFIFIVFSLSYTLYVLNRLFKTDSKKAFLNKAFLFILLFGVCFIIQSIFQFVLMFVTGAMRIDDFIPK